MKKNKTVAFICGPYQLHVFYAVCLDREISPREVSLICHCDSAESQLSAIVCNVAREVFGFERALNLENQLGCISIGPTSRRALKKTLDKHASQLRTFIGTDPAEFWHSLGSVPLEA